MLDESRDIDRMLVAIILTLALTAMVSGQGVPTGPKHTAPQLAEWWQVLSWDQCTR